MRASVKLICCGRLAGCSNLLCNPQSSVPNSILFFFWYAASLMIWRMNAFMFRLGAILFHSCFRSFREVTKQIEGHTICALGDAAAWREFPTVYQLRCAVFPALHSLVCFCSNLIVAFASFLLTFDLFTHSCARGHSSLPSRV